jgi:CO/xanthine dehydrogenase Mo-binding subunit
VATEASFKRLKFSGERTDNHTLKTGRPVQLEFFADTHDAVGPLGAKGMGECPVNPVAPALANALADATGTRFRDLPFTPDRIYRRIFERHVV